MATITLKAARFLGLASTTPSDAALDAAVDALGVTLGQPVTPLGPSLADVQVTQAQRVWNGVSGRGTATGV